MVSPHGAAQPDKERSLHPDRSHVKLIIQALFDHEQKANNKSIRAK